MSNEKTYVWVMTEGRLDEDYTVVGVYSTREKAVAAAHLWINSNLDLWRKDEDDDGTRILWEHNDTWIDIERLELQ